MGKQELIDEIEVTDDFIRTANWYVIFIKTFEEYRFATELQEQLDRTKYVVFVPTKDRSFRKKKEVHLHRVVLFAGYVFVASTDAPDKCFETLKPIVSKTKVAYKLLGEESVFRCAAVGERDKALLSRLMNKELHIAAIEAANVGDKVIVVDGAFESVEGRIKKINKYRQTVDVEICLFNQSQIVTFAYKLVAKEE